MTARQSPQTSGSSTARRHAGQYSVSSGVCLVGGVSILVRLVVEFFLHKMTKSRATTAAPVSLVLLLVGCAGSSGTQRPIGQAYAGPMTLALHQEISPKSPVAATVKHGDRLDILARRRRFVKVRTAGGAVGWTDLYKLLATEQMAELDKLAEKARALPSHGSATVYEPLNVHTEPHRQAPSFHQIKEGESVDVILHQATPRTAFEAPAVLPASRPPAKKAKKQPTVPPPPMPAAPKLPENWLELSKTDLPEELKTPPKPLPVDDWSLVRLQTGRAGWVVTGMLRMNIPDEVAQYSEGHRITSYFPMLEVQDQGQTRHHWLWTTLSATRQPWQFDGFRYFIWNVRRHRYETAYIERNVRGYFPVQVHKVQMTVGKKAETFPGFTLILEDEDGARWRKTYAYQYYRVVLVDQQKYEPPAAEDAPEVPMRQAAAPKSTSRGWLAQIHNLKKKWFGR